MTENVTDDKTENYQPISHASWLRGYELGGFPYMESYKIFEGSTDINFIHKQLIVKIIAQLNINYIQLEMQLQYKWVASVQSKLRSTKNAVAI